MRLHREGPLDSPAYDPYPKLQPLTLVGGTRLGGLADGAAVGADGLAVGVPARRVAGGQGVHDAGLDALAVGDAGDDGRGGAGLDGAGGVGHVDVLSGRSRRAPCAGPAPPCSDAQLPNVE